MPFDQSWMGFGMVGALEAGAISLVAGFVIYLIIHAIGGRAGWSGGMQISATYLIGFLLTAASDTWNLVYFSLNGVNSIQLLSAQLSKVHDPDNLGTRVFAEFVGVGIGLFVAWALFNGASRRRFFSGD